MWLFGVARRILLTSRRSGVRRQALVDRLREEALTREQIHTLRDDEVHEALARLSPLDAEIIRLRHWEGFNLVEIAHHLHRREGTIRSRYSRARQTLKEYLLE
ncbi:RNA polymerase sigma factor SigL [Microbacterium sp. SA39]|nr:RNA polymerase sigma factor SigL [Microbacterium sp. SA39]